MEQFFVFLQKSPMNIVLFGTVLVSGGMLLWPAITRLMNRSQDVESAQAVQLINLRDAVVIDVRNAEDYKAGHIRNSRHIPERELEGRIKELEKYKAKPVIVSCGRGNRSAAVAAKLRKLGFAEVLSLRGGIAGWQQASLPLEKS
jgi:rhodanese-related sulfurtransferase